MASIQLKIYSAALKTRTNVNVLLPSLLPDQNGATKRKHDFTTYYETHKDFPVLYLLHGTFGDEGDWQRFTRIEDYARNHNLAVVMPYGENSFYRDTDNFGFSHLIFPSKLSTQFYLFYSCKIM